jgi:NADH-quinone oxidoreductase subunit E
VSASSTHLTAASLAKIDKAVAKYPSTEKQSAVMAALTIAQDEKGWLSPESIDFVAEYLQMPAVAVYEVATFYTMYDLQPVGRFKLTICTNLPHLKSALGVGFNETTADGLFTLKEGECMGACGDAPVMLQNNKRMLCGMNPEQIDRLLATLKVSGGT